MFRLSPRRSQRSRGFKVKHAVQVCLLLAICIWLLYQVKHSHDKKAAFSEDEKSWNQIKLGRKDLNPLVMTTTIEDVRQREEENEEENKYEGEESNKHDGESEDEGKGNADDETNERDPDRTEKEVDHGEEFVDREKEGEEKKANESEENSEQRKDKEAEEHVEDSADKEMESEETKEKEKEEDSEPRKDEGTEEERRENIKEEAKEESKDKDSFEKKEEGGEEKEIKPEMKEENIEQESNKNEWNKIKEMVSSENQIDVKSDKDASGAAALQETQSSINGTEEVSENLKDGDHSEDKGNDEFEQENKSNNTNIPVDKTDSGPDMTNNETFEKNDPSIVSSVEQKGSRTNSASEHGSTQQSEIEITSDAPKNQSETTDMTTASFKSKNETVDSTPGDSSAVETVVSGQTEKSDAANGWQSESNVKLLTTETIKAGMKNSSSTNSENYYSSLSEGNINDNANAGQKEPVDSSAFQEGRTVFSDTNNDVDAGQKEHVDPSVSQEGRAEFSDTNNDVDAGQKELVGSSVSRGGKAEFSDTNNNVEAGENRDHDVSSVIEGTRGTESVYSKPSANQEQKEASSSTNNNANLRENDSVDFSHSSSSSVLKEDKDARTDLGALRVA